MTQLATNGTRAPAIPRPVEMPRSEAIERALVNGDVSGLSQRERWDYYVMRCEAAGLDPRAQPFQYVSLSGRLVLYATKAAADQLIASRKLSVSLVSRGFDEETGLYSVHARALFPDGQSVEDLGTVWIMKGEIGEKLANAVLKCVTKAKRRTVLSACGLGMLDETEIDSIPGAVRVNSEALPLTIERPDPPPTVHPPNHEPKSQEVSAAKQWVRDQIQAAKDELRNHLLIDQKFDQYDEAAKLLPKDPAQVAQALVSDWINRELLDPAQVLKADGKRDNQKVGAALSVAFSQDEDETKAEVKAYVRGKLDAALRAAGVQLAGDSDAAQAASDGE